MPIAYIADRIFDGERFLVQHAVITDQGQITGIVPADATPAGAELHTLAGRLLAPAFIDLQIYGGDGKMFSLFPSVEALQATYAYCTRGGTSHFMATVATNSMDIVYQAISAVRTYWQRGLPGLLGLHLEGPYLNPEKKGAHLPQYIKQPTLREVHALLDKGGDVIRMMTIAPECCSREVIASLTDAGVVVSAGHSNATYEQAMDAFGLGIPTATHLYNAMSPLRHRAPGLVGAVFNSQVFASIVVDGIHVSFPAVRIAKEIMKERLFLITDAVTEGRSDSYTYILQHDRYVTDQGTLAGSCLTQGKGVKNLIDHVAVLPGEALRMASLYPAKVIGKEDRYGRIAQGYPANMAVLNGSFEVESILLSEEMG